MEQLIIFIVLAVCILRLKCLETVWLEYYKFLKVEDPTDSHFTFVLLPKYLIALFESLDMLPTLQHPTMPTIVCFMIMHDVLL